MDLLSLFWGGVIGAFEPQNFIILVTGLMVGTVAGALPGISFVNAMAMALPFTYVMAPVTAMCFLGGIYVGGVFGGSISSILINIPGTPASLPACWDGYPMTVKGCRRAPCASPSPPPRPADSSQPCCLPLRHRRSPPSR